MPPMRRPSKRSPASSDRGRSGRDRGGHRSPSGSSQPTSATPRSARRAKGRVVEVVRTLVFGTMLLLGAYLWRSRASTSVNTSFVERHNGTDRHQNSRKHRKTYGFSKDIEVHHAASYFIGYSYNFCWCVRTLRVRGEDGSWQQRTPAMAAGLTGHVWSLWEWITYPPRPR